MGTSDANAKPSSSLIKDFIHKCGGVAVIDGGFATELERHGADLNDPLWSAKCLFTDPHLVRAVHLDYLEAGADIILSSSYQATIQGFKAKGYSIEESESFLKRSVEIACEARDVYCNRCRASSSDHSTEGKDFHRRRVQLLADSGADLIAFETVPNKLEAQAFVELLKEEDIKTPAWLSFNSKDGVNVVSGDSLSECAAIGESCEKVLAVGINCTPPRFILDLILSIKQVTTKPILIYPNSGESYDGIRKEWVSNTGITDEDFVPYVNKWCEAGAALVGGCCRTTPNTIREIYNALSGRRTV
ncbi:hypothetical protein HAX54_030116 [Datura stramonium]|uniref:Hcy-binding domain-containing protein n=1 Tax=Datura stramonium TaxID=4076 RepID=A0ABS8SAT7_DATST|nr:hypothetical protein [Datura stramonium]